MLPILVMVTILYVVSQRQHLLMALLALEGMILMLIMLVVSTSGQEWPMFILIILCFGACEASLGLACMVIMARSYGNDHLSLLSINKC
nr:NADH dehydrogenase subunit 4L [Tylorrhynchus heterochaetus]